MTLPLAILFDLDGTLLDTAPEFAHCLNQLLDEEERPRCSLASLKEWVTLGAKGMVQHGFNLPPSDPRFPSLVTRFLEHYASNLGCRTKLFPGIEDVIKQLDNKAIPWGIITNKLARYTTPLVSQFPSLANAKCIVSGDTLDVQKPHPNPLLHACRAIGVPPANAWYIGDAKTDMEAAIHAGTHSAIATYGYLRVNDDPSGWGATTLLNAPSEISRLLHI